MGKINKNPKLLTSLSLLLLAITLSSCSQSFSPSIVETSETESPSETILETDTTDESSETEIISETNSVDESSETETISETETNSDTFSEVESDSEINSDDSNDYDGYYKGITTSEGGDYLLTQLQNLMFDTHTFYPTYGDIRYQFIYSDADPDIEGNIITFYTKTSINGTWDYGNTYNREHVWPKSLSNDLYTSSNTKNENANAGTDLHHIRPALTATNSDRGNKLFGTSSGYYLPNEDVRGDCARIIMYMYAHYSKEVTYTGNSTAERSSYCGNLVLTNVFQNTSLIQEWNQSDPVDDFEKARNEYCYSYQGNRNPFIDHPEWIDIILG